MRKNVLSALKGKVLNALEDLECVSRLACVRRR